MIRVPTCVAAVLLLCAGPAAAQEHRIYVGLSALSVAAEGAFEIAGRRAFSPMAVIGFRVAPAGALELSVSHVRSRGTHHFAVPDESPAEASLTVETEALPVTAAYNQGFRIRGVGAEPFVTAGLVAARVRDTYESDTPPDTLTSTLFGFQVHIGVRVPVLSRASVTTHAGYRRLERDSPGPGFELSGLVFGAGVQLEL